MVPRPIAWVSTVGPDGVNNLAPFSFFMGVCQEPPTIAFSSGPRAGSRKDTVRNAEHTGDFVVNVVDDDRAEQMNLTSGEYPPEVDEFALDPSHRRPGRPGARAARRAGAHQPRVPRGPDHPGGPRPPQPRPGRDRLLPRARRPLRSRPPGASTCSAQAGGPPRRAPYAHVHDIFEMKRPDPGYAG